MPAWAGFLTLWLLVILTIEVVKINKYLKAILKDIKEGRDEHSK